MRCLLHVHPPGACHAIVCAVPLTIAPQYWDSLIGAYRPATSPAECAASGFCDDWQMDTVWGGACVYEPETYYRRPCRRRFNSVCPNSAPNATICGPNPQLPECQACLAADVGCVILPLSTNQSFCESTPLTAASCAACTQSHHCVAALGCVCCASPRSPYRR